MRIVPLVALLLCLSTSPALAGDPADTPTTDALLEAVVACPLSLGEAMGIAFAPDRRAIGAEFLLTPDADLLLRATVRVEKDEQASFETWIGRVNAAGWVPHRSSVGDTTKLADAERRWALMQDDPDLLTRALKGAVRTEERPGPADVALSVAVAEREGRKHAFLRIGAKGRVRGLRFDPDDETYQVVAPTSSPKAVAYAPQALPEFGIAGAEWFNATKAPTLAAWRESPILVVITDPG